MATVIADDARLIFQHIPKCAGTSVAVQLQDQVRTDGRFHWSARVEIDGVGFIRGGHMPLEVVRHLYPDALEKFRSYRSYAIVREPRSRFRSALGEFLRVHLESSLYNVKDKDLADVLDEIMRETRRSPVWLSERYVHFTRQTDFIELDGERLIGRLYMVDNLDRLADDLREHHGLHFNPRTIYNSHKDKALKFGLPKGALDRTARAVWSVFPVTLRRRIMSGLNRTMPEPRIPASTEALLSSDSVTRFIAEHYAPDFRIWEALQDRPAPRSAVAAASAATN